MNILIFGIISAVIALGLLISSGLDWGFATVKRETIKAKICVIGCIIAFIIAIASFTFIGDVSLYTPYDTQEIAHYYVDGEIVIDSHLYIKTDEGTLWQQDKDNFRVIKVEKKESDDELDKIVINKVKAKYGIFTTTYNELIIYK
jgi:hypothetical protein